MPSPGAGRGTDQPGVVEDRSRERVYNGLLFAKKRRRGHIRTAPEKDNNAAERMIRGPVVTRKNARGSHNGDTARNAAVIWTVTGTAQMADLNILTYLAAYLDECGRNGGKPLTGPALERFLPWNASPEHLRTWAQPPPAG